MAAVSESVRVLIVDDEALMRAGLRLMIDGAAGISVVGEAANGAAAVTQDLALDPDVILMDIRMPGSDGLEATRELQNRGARARVVVLTAFDTDGYLLDALRAGAVSFLLKDSPPEVVVEAVLDAARGRARFSPDVLARLVRLAAAGGPVGTPRLSTESPEGRPADVTPREWEVGTLVAQGLTNQEIGATLFLSLPTVKTHIGRLFDKLAVTNRVQLAIRVLELSPPT